MIKQIRVDYRLLHGQVAVSWTSALGADCLLLVRNISYLLSAKM